MVPETWTMSRSFGMTNWWWRLTDAGDADFAKRRRSDGKSTDGTKNPFELPKKSCKVSQEWPENPQEKDLSYQSYLLFFCPSHDMIVYYLPKCLPVISEFCCHLAGMALLPLGLQPGRLRGFLSLLRGGAAVPRNFDPRSWMKLATASPAGSLLARPKFDFWIFWHVILSSQDLIFRGI